MKKISALAIALLLVACGGGGGEGAPVTKPIDAPVQTPVAKAWQPPELLEKERGDTGSAQVVTDSAGNAFAVWAQVSLFTGGMYTNVWVRRYEPATGWGPAQVLSRLHQGPAASPRIAVDPGSGTAMLVWRQFNPDTGGESIWSRRYAGGSWGEAALVESVVGGGPSFVPDVAINAQGEAVAVWLRQESDNVLRRDAWANRHVNGSWGAVPVLLDQTNFQIEAVKVALNEAGSAVAVWTQGAANATARTDIVGRHRDADGQWLPESLVESDDLGRAYEPQVVMDAQGRALAAWRYSQAPNAFEPSDMRSARANAAGVWAGSELVNAVPGAATFTPRLAMDGAGNAMAVWSEFDGDTNLLDVWSNRLEEGATTWSAARRIDSELKGDAQRPHISMDAAGNAVVVWDQGDGLGFEPDDPPVLFSVATNRYTPGKGWGLPERLQTNAGGEELLNARVALSASGKAFAVWLEGDVPTGAPAHAKDPWVSVFR